MAFFPPQQYRNLMISRTFGLFQVMIQNHFVREFTSKGCSTWATQGRTLAYEKFSSQSKILLWGELNRGAKDQHPQAPSSTQPLRPGLHPLCADNAFYNWQFLEVVKLGQRTPSTVTGKENTHNLFFTPWVTILYGFLVVDVTAKFSCYTLSTPGLSCLYSSRMLKRWCWDRSGVRAPWL